MTTSGVTVLSDTRNDIITMAYEDLGVFAPGFQILTAGQVNTANRRLNYMLKAWQAAGIGLWLNSIYTQVLAASAQYYSLGPASLPNPIARPLGIVEARLVDTSGNEQIMTPMSRDEYMTLPLKSSTGAATQYYFDPQLVNAVFYVWPVETDLTKVIKMTLRRPIENFVNAADSPDLPDEWFDAIHFSLAMRMAPAFKIDAKQYGMIKEQAKITMDDANNFDREQNTSVCFTSDVQGQ